MRKAAAHERQPQRAERAMDTERAETFFPLASDNDSGGFHAMREQPKMGAASVGNRAPPHGGRLARRCPGRASEPASEMRKAAAYQRQPQRAERAMDTERAEAFFPLRATTTAADSMRDARAAQNGGTAASVLAGGTFFAGGGVGLRGPAAEHLLQHGHGRPHILRSLQPLPMFERQLVLYGGDVFTEHRRESGGDAESHLVEALA